MRLFVYKTVLAQSTDHDSVALHCIRLDTLQNFIIEVTPVTHCGWFCVYGTGLETIKSIPVPDKTLFIVADPDAEQRCPRALLEQSKPNTDLKRYWFRVDNLSPSGRDYEFDTLADYIGMELSETLAHQGVRAPLSFTYFALPTNETLRSIHPVEVLQRILPRFGICSVYTVHHDCLNDLAKKNTCSISPKQFAEVFQNPEKTYVHTEVPHIMEYCIINCTTLTTGAKTFKVEFSSEAHAKECAKLDGTSLESVLQSIKGLDLKLVFVKSPMFKPKKQVDLFFPDDGSSRVLSVISPDQKGMSSTKLNPHWIFVPLFQDTTRADIDEMLPVAITMSQFASVPLNFTLMDRLTTSKSLKLVEFWITKTMLQRGYNVLPYPKRSKLNEKKKKKGDSLGGAVKTPVTGVHFSDETHVIVMVDLQSFYSSIIAEKNMCITQPLSYLLENPALSSDIKGAQKKIKKIDDHSVAKLEPFKKLTKAEKTKLTIQGKEIPSLKIKKLEGRLAPIAEEAWRGVNERRCAPDQIVKNALKKMLSCLYGVMLNNSMRYGVRQMGVAITSWGRFYINEIGNRLHSVLCDRANADKGFLLGITDSILLHASRQPETDIEELIKHNLALLQLTKLRINKPEFFDAVYIQNKTGYAFLKPGQKILIEDTIRALEPIKKKVPKDQKEIYINIMTTVLLKASTESVTDLIGQLATTAEDEGPSSDAHIVGKIIVARYMSLFAPEVLKSEEMARLARVTSVGTLSKVKSKVNSIKGQSSSHSHIIIEYEHEGSERSAKWWEASELDNAIGFM